MAEIIISGITVLVDDEDVERILHKKWRVDTTRVHKGEFYFQCSLGTRAKHYNIYLHRFIIGCEYGDGKEVDHANRNTLDNRKQNLRICTRAQNGANKGMKSGTRSGYRGVHYSGRDDRWVCHVNIDGKSTHIGTYATKEDAARAYDIMALRLYGEFANTNFSRTSYTGKEGVPASAERIMPSNNTSGCVGVCYRKDTKKWRVFISKDKSRINVGTYLTKEEAIEARLNAEKTTQKVF